MAGEPNTVARVAAASGAGALGSFGAAFTAPGDILDAAQAIRARTDRPFAFNLFTGDDNQADGATFEAARAALGDVYRDLGVEPPGAPARPQFTLADQIAAVLEARPAAFSFTFGLPEAEAITACRRRDIATIGTATNTAEVEALDALGVDAICVQGAEAGGHRGTFIGPIEDSLIGTWPLAELALARTRRPVLVAGGIMSGRGVAAALAMGAAAAQVGTLFLTSGEAGTPAAHRAALLSRSGPPTALTQAFTGRLARGIENAFIRRTRALAAIAPHPTQRQLTAPIRRAAAERRDPDYMQMWAGQGYPLCRVGPAASLVRALISEAEDAAPGRL
jgi:nitronate monooxygenase